jgi:CO/xanthine dehydrogenase FAD-binding subunit
MRTNVSAYTMRALSLPATLELLARQPGVWKPFAGGTDLMVLLEAGKLSHQKYLSIRHLDELSGIGVSEHSVRIGALATYSEILRQEALRREFPLLVEAAKQTGGVATQNRGTLGGNIANASPAADSPPALLVYDAKLELLSANGTRVVPYERFHSGYKAMDLRPEELIAAVEVSRAMRGWRQYYRKVGTRRAQAISKVCFAAAAECPGAQVGDIRIALGSVAPTVVRCRRTEEILRGRTLSPSLVRDAQTELAEEIAPIDDLRSTAHYRLRVAQNLLAEFLHSLAAAA